MNTKLNENIDEIKGLIFSIQSYSVHDGPGTRTTVFMNDCPLRCKWCCNPEGLFNKPVMLHSTVKCIKCGACIKACPNNAISVKDGNLIFDRTICNKCTTMECVDVCLNEGNSISGKYYTIPELMHRFDRERSFWGDKGGMTLSGGEPLLQRKFILPLLKECKKKYIHTCIETTGCLDSEYWLEVTKYVDWIFMDLKNMDTDKHKSMTGVNNELILKNIKLIAERKDWEGIIVPRIPIIPGFNDDDDNIRKTAKYVKEIGLEVINILPFHKLGESKYRQLNQKYMFDNQVSPSEEHMEHLKSIIVKEGIMCFIGHNTPF